ncbi:maleylpyruvate isomerase family mycothiol-dependent enzyme [Kribbella sp. NPDC023855]|uniref:maleylpyruvate isomerase family mycothiol-dependent enzyme n=1 Tax=Kribbella sp. NPDC023855 TaxID=3154698 RepID=UPI0033DC9D46
MSELPQLIRTERLALADFLETLGPTQWATRSLCDEWTVQDVAAHLAWAPLLRPSEMIPAIVKARFRLNKASAEIAKRWAERGPEAIVAQLRQNAETDAKPPGVPEIAALVDAVVHAIDIRHPLSSPRPVPPEAFTPVADFSVQAKWPMNVSVGGSARKRLAGVRLVAEGYNWSYGEGHEVRAAGDTVLRILNGRGATRQELTGDGATHLAMRLNP